MGTCSGFAPVFLQAFQAHISATSGKEGDASDLGNGCDLSIRPFVALEGLTSSSNIYAIKSYTVDP